MALKDKYFSVSQAAKELGVTRQTVHRWIADGKVPAEKIGRETLVQKRKIRQFHERNLFQTLTKGLSRFFIGYIQKKYHYSKKDKIEQVGDESVTTFVVTKADGSREKVEIRGFALDWDESQKQKLTIIKVKPLKVIRTRIKKKGRE